MSEAAYKIDVMPVWGCVRLLVKLQNKNGRNSDFSVDLPLDKNFAKFLTRISIAMQERNFEEIEYKNSDKNIRIKYEQYQNVNENLIINFYLDYFETVFRFEMFSEDFEPLLRSMIRFTENLL